ncbi:bifunctional proline dehydrogenase/L-glutamate gamma-semialdehyde dehydrogenase PutA [Motiliproteus sediminis]|uniref:bifunctional proline dehydrogenase/L-glutamate gamma-semialdehyde dehydrogenase PutA n=1 Tax=Motiliproteus sediminis TaxID=1468178 RepID=UPI001AEFE07D|nr:bifunctional proline dehydrogenase/L-glutamate gamma-semialdehyde dehydrogenase PutA [Motiliproteus sediminis]
MFSAAQLFSGELLHHTPEHILDQLRRCYDADQQRYIDGLLPLLRFDADDERLTRERCERWVRALRRHPPSGLAIEALLQEFPLGRADGLALMALAEALLRIPDSSTADALIRTRLRGADWRSHDDHDNLWLKSAHQGLKLAQSLIASEHHHSLAGIGQRLGQPLIRQALKQAVGLISDQFVCGETIYEALDNSQQLLADGDTVSFDMLGEAALCAEDAQRFFDAYQHAISALGCNESYPPGALRPAVSIKLSALHPRFEWSQRERWRPVLNQRMASLISLARQHRIAVTIDAEESDRLEPTLALFADLLAGPAHGWGLLGIAVQAYSRRALATLAWLTATARHHRTSIPVRLVKGAYWDSEIKWAQQRGLEDYPVFTAKSATDLNYQACARYLFCGHSRDRLYPQFATHNARTLADILTLSDGRPFECQRLFGMGEALYREARNSHSFPCRVYAPVGAHRELLPYLVRRLLENGANSSFVNQIYHPGTGLEALAVPATAQWPPAGSLPRPAEIFAPERANSRGLNLQRPDTASCLEDWMAEPLPWRQAAPLINGSSCLQGEPVRLFSPQDQQRDIGDLYPTDAATATRAIDCVSTAAQSWAATPAAARAACLDRLAVLLERHRSQLIPLLVAEAGKTLPHALDEVREAVDFCHYYARQAEKLFTPQSLPGPTGEDNRLLMAPRGLFVCISPWNFPLAIFTGQVSAALVCGNGVIAKPARQTSLIATLCCELMLEAGIPVGVLALLPGPSEGFCDQLLADQRIDGVAFTGSSASALAIQRRLAAREHAPIATLIAETGGQNAMIVDSSALPEQVVRDALDSAFGAAGQRCSALRLLCLQEEIADSIETLLIGALKERQLGDPAQLATDIGPVIDAQAQQLLLNYLSQQQAAGRLLYQGTVGDHLSQGSFVAPAVVRLQRVDQLGEEQFGPILHLLRYRADHSEQLVDAINQLGYGLTLGIHSRNSAHAEALAMRARVGNVYINRHQTGAVVGSQPFGGCGLSGTGPKAGGPHYLRRFVYEKHLCTDTTAWGGNAALLSDR